MSTKALYLADTYLFQSSAKVEGIEQDEQGLAVILDQTIFYPQGGGQPTDIGVITSNSAEFQVNKVLYRPDGAIAHYGSMVKSEMKVGDEVSLSIDKDRRLLNARNHSAGHMLDFAVEKHYPQLVGIKGYHFPEGPYVEFEGSLSDEEKEQLPMVIQEAVQEMVTQEQPVTTRLVEAEELAKLCKHVLPNLPKDKPTRAMIVGDLALGCGGTHISNAKEVGSFIVRKVKKEQEKVRISYAIG